uniref:EF-hand domain-containing protein n=1 Tax=uncultured Verrucomicrobiales bacterium HF4000_13K17 TaxID=710998 RepID=E0XVN9_9BACT|nr:hypothetical protein [uncultured Verrucomicrobiales bacterium HF4000_13K17]
MDLEMKCPHCDQWTASNVESCSKCGGLLFESKEGPNSFISSLKKNWKLATGLAVTFLILSILFFRPNPTPPPEKQAQNLPTEKQKEPPRQKPNLPPEKPKQQKPDLSGQLGFYGQWDKDKDGYLKGTEIATAMTELNKVEMNVIDISGESRVVKFRWEPPRMDMDLDQRLSKEELAQGNRGYFLFQEYDLDKDGLLSKAEIEKAPSAVDITGTPRKQPFFEPLKKFDLNQDGKLALLEIPPYHSYFWSGMGRGKGSSRGRGEGKGGRDSVTRKPSADEVINRALTDYKTNLGAQAAKLQDLVNEGYLNSIPDPPAGTKWVLNPDGTLTTQRK